MNLSEHPLHRLFCPRRVAVVGASANLDSLTGRTIKVMKRFGFSGDLFPVNPKYDQVGGYQCYKNLADIPGSADVAVISVKANIVPSVLETCIAKGIPNAVIYSSGFAETGNKKLQEQILSIARSGKIRILGPNCQGLLNLAEKTPLTFTGALLDVDPPKAGHVAFVSQSGAFGFSSFGVGLDHGVNYRYVVTTGNQADVDAVECASYVICDPQVRLLMMYLEGIGDGQRFLQMVKDARERNIAVAVLKAGRSPISQKAAQSHTAALTGDEAVWDAIFDQYGIIPMEDMDDITGIGQMFGARQRATGDRVAILTTSGGAGIVMADSLTDLKIQVPELSADTQKKMAENIPSFGSPRNPVDMTIQVSETPEKFQQVLKTAMNDPDVHMVVTALSMVIGKAGDVMADELIRNYQTAEKPQAVVWMIDQAHGGSFIQRLKDAGIPIFQSFRQCARSLRAMVNWHQLRALPKDEPVTGTPILQNYPPLMSEYDAKCLLSKYGIPVTREALCTNMEEAFDAADDIGFPLVLKGMSGKIMHKTEADVVRLDIRTLEELRQDFKKMRTNMQAQVADADIQGFLVGEMVKGGMECIVGIKRDPVFGPVVAVGLGGIYVEVLGDVSLRHAPVDEAEALRMIQELKGFGFLSGARGQKRKDTAALARIVSQVSKLACVEPDLLELDINPVFVMPEGQGAVAADALIVRNGQSHNH